MQNPAVQTSCSFLLAVTRPVLVRIYGDSWTFAAFPNSNIRSSASILSARGHKNTITVTDCSTLINAVRYGLFVTSQILIVHISCSCRPAGVSWKLR